ncbi:MAG: histidine phosphatase family protein [Actinobacteria bacterium]|jgi:probable phosphoglycerate mutase|nr:histidine phosphatase family protein [Actinomycetota bacterium]
MTPTIVLIRHGETLWSKSGQHTGLTDIPLTDNGRERASALAPRLASRAFGLVLTSPLSRAQETAHLAGLDPQDDPDLLEWDYGAWEGRTTADIRVDQQDPTWVVWDHPVPVGATPGEQPEDVAIRAHRVIRRCQPFLASGESVALVAHGHFLRILTATWLGLPATAGRLFALEAGALSGLGFERDQHVITYWNT